MAIAARVVDAVRLTTRAEDGAMGGAFKAIELVGTSEQSFDDAARAAVQRAGETMRNLEWMEVLEQRGYIGGGRVGEYRVKLKIGFKPEGGRRPGWGPPTQRTRRRSMRAPPGSYRWKAQPARRTRAGRACRSACATSATNC